MNPLNLTNIRRRSQAAQRLAGHTVWTVSTRGAEAVEAARASAADVPDLLHALEAAYAETERMNDHLSYLCRLADRLFPDPEPQPSDGPDYHADHAAWADRQDAPR